VGESKRFYMDVDCSSLRQWVIANDPNGRLFCRFKF